MARTFVKKKKRKKERSNSIPGYTRTGEMKKKKHKRKKHDLNTADAIHQLIFFFSLFTYFS
ncbi:hypothetical protein BO85DRAFT_451486 [Aspergillus piperis CBS 112811]|uniref:Uncharacterized protein n=1 Tax=Aspergillus piperis CBS 112811 TaxID=1448313 RepID=A0A8G1QWT7_9EURO|nr:hypothetical protein BO85DRAFT_451486 [Aspergillus piperis CBS 112811]RAH55134.1 hypothetical protein BO85DRAFT_451486 [Aspergillus piperis CBS 112811]